MPESGGEEISIEEIAEEIRRAMPDKPSGDVRRPDESIRALAVAERHIVPGLDPGTKLASAKTALLRVLRIVTRSQGTYNAAMLEAARELQQKLDDARREIEELRGVFRRIEGRVAEIASATDEIRHRQEDVVVELRADTARSTGILRDELVRELAGARQNLTERLESAQQSAQLEIRRLQRELDLAHARFSREERAVTAPPEGGATTPAISPPAAARLPDGFYVRFEEQFRGTEEDVRARQDLYAKFFVGAPGVVLDCGCGRGEFLEVLRAHGIASQGVDTNAISIELAASKGLDVILEDAFANLRRRGPTLGGIAALQVVEHLDPAKVYEFLELALAALVPGGLLLLETINPDSVYALRAFRLDPTHRWPVPAATLELMAREVGFEGRRIEMLSPVPGSERLVESDENDRRLNRLLFGPQDYALFAEKRR